MKYLIAASFIAAMAVSPGARAQSVQPPDGLSTRGESIGLPPANPYQGSHTGERNPTFTLFGIPVRITAPVNAPYTQSATTTYAGQPMLGKDAVLARGLGSGFED